MISHFTGVLQPGPPSHPTEAPMIRKFLRSFVTGYVGLAHALASEQNMRIHGVIAVCVIAASFYLALAAWEWIALTFCIGLVISAECMNTAVERLADRVSLETHPLIRQAKDCSSAAVLVLAIMSAVVGAIVFVPKISSWLGW
jgi:diacylglycerol kinase